MTLQPPEARRSSTVLHEHGFDRADPYDWMAESDDPEVATYLQAERHYYEARTASLEADRQRLTADMVARVPSSESSAPWEVGAWRYREHTLPGNEHPRLVRAPIAGGDDIVLLDLQQVHDEAGTGYTRTGVCEISPNSEVLAWSIDTAGDEVYQLRFRDLTSATDLPDVLPRTYYGGAWTTDSGAFLYTVHDDAYRPHQVWRHRLGSDIATDELLFDERDERFEVDLHTCRSGEIAVISCLARDSVEQHVIDLRNPEAQPVLVRPRASGLEYDVEHAPGHGPDGGDGFYVVTNDGAPEFRVAWAATEDLSAWMPLIDGSDSERIHAIDAFALGYVVTLRRNGAACLRLVNQAGDVRDLVPGEAGGQVSLGRNEEWNASFVTVVESSFITPAVHADVPFDGSFPSERHRIEVIGVNPDHYVSERHLAPSPDGVPIPVITVRHRATPLNGTAPCVLYGYGSYEASCDPDWGIDWWRSLPSLLDRGVVFAVGHPRGGGEMGRAWWESGHLATKANTFDDQAAVADFLARDVIDGSRIVTRGLSAGGLLQGALYSRRPRRWAGVIAEVPFVDVVTTMFDESAPLTAQEWKEWGDPRIKEEYEWLRAYSPVDNRPDVSDRPPLLVTGAVHDPRVMVREPAKWVASLRHDDPHRGMGDDPTSPVSRGSVLFRCEVGAGAHGGPSGRFAPLAYEAELAAWCCAAMGVAVLTEPHTHGGDVQPTRTP